MDLSKLMMGGALIGVLTACWSQIKQVGWRIISLLIQRVEFDKQAFDHVLSYAVKHCKRSSIYDMKVNSHYELVKPKNFEIICYEELGESEQQLLFWVGWAPVLFSVTKKTTSGNQEKPASEAVNQKLSFCIYSIRFLLNFKKFVRTAVSTFNEDRHEHFRKNSDRFFILFFPGNEASIARSGASSFEINPLRQLLSHDMKDIGYEWEDLKKGLSKLVFPTKILDLIEEIRIWFNNKAWYNKRNIPWKRGWLLYGPPGTGKTAFARGTAQELSIPLIVFNLAQIGSNKELLKEWARVKGHAPCVVLIEDIDNIFDGRKCLIKRDFSELFSRGKDESSDSSDTYGGLSFDTFLNCLDGVETTEGIFVIITTNDISKIDPALGVPTSDGSSFISTRPGRIDKVIEFGYMEKAEKYVLAERILGDYPEDLQKIRDYIDENEFNETPAQFQELCSQIAVRRFVEHDTSDDILEKIKARNQLKVSA